MSRTASHSRSQVLARAEAAMSVPLLRLLGAELIDDEHPARGLSFEAGDQTINAADYLHGGVISTVLDVAAWLSVLPELNDDEGATTHNLLVSYLSELRGRASLTAVGTVIKCGRRLAFATAELRHSERLLATAHVTKSIVPARRP
jgi:uncharacterized protein (TIGR00369 family)